MHVPLLIHISSGLVSDSLRDSGRIDIKIQKSLIVQKHGIYNLNREIEKSTRMAQPEVLLYVHIFRHVYAHAYVCTFYRDWMTGTPILANLNAPYKKDEQFCSRNRCRLCLGSHCIDQVCLES